MVCTLRGPEPWLAGFLRRSGTLVAVRPAIRRDTLVEAMNRFFMNQIFRSGTGTGDPGSDSILTVQAGLEFGDYRYFVGLMIIAPIVLFFVRHGAPSTVAA